MKLDAAPAPLPAEEAPREREGGERADAEIPEAVRSVLADSENVTREPSAVAAAAASTVAATIEATTREASVLPVGLVVGRVLTVRDGEVDLLVNEQIVTARKLGAMHGSVLATAQRTGEPVIAQRSADGSIEVMGALRTQPTPGVDDMREIVLEADRVELRGRKEVALTTSGLAAIALRAAGEVETYADRIVSRAEELHKIVGKMLRLN